ncbi:MAG: sodium:calcium antiporter [Actinomycetota bacterium]
MFSSQGLAVLVVIFAVAAAGVWVAGVWLTKSTDVIAERLGLGEALGGLILLAFATNLPEIAITISAAAAHNLGIAIGNILGGIAIQTVVLVVLDVAVRKNKTPLTHHGADLGLVLEGTLVIAVLIVALMGSRLPHTLALGRTGPGEVLIFILWVAGVWLIGKARTDLPWGAQGDAPGGQQQDRGMRSEHTEKMATSRGIKTGRAALIFGIAAVVTLAGGVLLEQSGEGIAKHIGLDGVIFGATILAAATALPELSTGIQSVRIGDFKLAISDIFGGNAFLPVLFLPAALIAGTAVLPQIDDIDLYLTGLGILLTAVYIYGLIFRPKRRVAGIGVDSAVVVVLYVAGLVGLTVLATK